MTESIAHRADEALYGEWNSSQGFVEDRCEHRLTYLHSGIAVLSSLDNMGHVQSNLTARVTNSISQVAICGAQALAYTRCVWCTTGWFLISQSVKCRVSFIGLVT